MSNQMLRILFFVVICSIFATSCSKKTKKKNKIIPTKKERKKVALTLSFDDINFKTELSDSIITNVKKALLKFNSLEFKYKVKTSSAKGSVTARGECYILQDSAISVNVKVSILDLGDYVILRNGMIINHSKNEVKAIYHLDTINRSIEADINYNVVSSMLTSRPFFLEGLTYTVEKLPIGDYSFSVTYENYSQAIIFGAENYTMKQLKYSQTGEKKMALELTFREFKLLEDSEYYFPKTVDFQVFNEKKILNGVLTYKSVKLNKRKTIKFPLNNK